MRLLLDTHALYWWLYFPERLSGEARARIAAPDAEVMVSAITAYEMAYKHRLGKWSEVGLLVGVFEQVVRDEQFGLLPITARHAARAGSFPTEHRDPFDRILAAQAIAEDLLLVTDDSQMATLGAQTLWRSSR
jgi:PIN domain nuclease of toxin-antitoxin system